LVELLWRVSTLALRHAYTTVYPDTADLSGLEPPTPPPAPGSPAEAARLRVTQARVAVERRAFVERAAAGLKAAQEAEATAADLTSEYRCVCLEEGLYDHRGRGMGVRRAYTPPHSAITVPSP
jgi:hypothetical protein